MDSRDHPVAGIGIVARYEEKQKYPVAISRLHELSNRCRKAWLNHTALVKLAQCNLHGGMSLTVQNPESLGPKP